MRHAKLPMAKPSVHPKHPFRDRKMHDSLVEYIKERLSVGKQARDAELGRLIRIDKKVAGWIRLRDEDRKRVELAQNTGEPEITKMNLPLAFVHLDDMMTYLAETFAPSSGMFYNTGNPQEQDSASQIVTKMNNDALYAGYYREVLQSLFGALKYNLGGVTVSWGVDTGPSKSDKSTAVDRIFDAGLKWQGNRLRALDRYNTFLDPSVHPSKLYMDGEFCAYAELKSRYWVQTRGVSGQFYNLDEALMHSMAGSCEYYRHPPTEARLDQREFDDGSDSTTDWVSILSASPSTLQDGHEVVTVYIRLNPAEFGLVLPNEVAARTRYELWRFTLLDGKYIVSAAHQDNVHNHIPCYFALINDDSMGVAQRSVSELLIPLQDFSSHLLNTHQDAARRSLYGTTFYDPTMVDLAAVPRGEVAARVPLQPRAYGRDVRSFVYHMGTDYDTSRTTQDLQVVMGLINQFFPTQALPSQIASIDRAVSSQVAAVQHGANRRQQKSARLVDDTMFRPMRFAIYYNILQYQPDGEELTDFYTGKQVKLDIAGMADTNLPYIVGQGLKAIDRMATREMIQQVIFALIQAPQAAQGIDLLAMIDFWTSMIDVDIDMKQFRLQPAAVDPATGQPVDPAAAPAAGDNPIQPATNPGALTEPIYGGN
jgi:hypothetical protein